MNDADLLTSGTITITERPDKTVAHLRGNVDVTLRESAGAALLRILDRNRPVILDASEIRSIDSAGIAFLIQCCTIARDEGLHVTLFSPPAPVRDVLALLGLEHVFDEQN